MTDQNNTSIEKETRLLELCTTLADLTEGQIGWVEKVIEQFHKPATFWRLDDSDIMNECTLQAFGDALRIHHCFSNEAFTKDKFEYALERVSKLCHIDATLSPRGNPGHDITINGLRYSLKSQADKNIRAETLHISKFMELGKGQWSDQEDHLIGLRNQFFEHMNSYDRILSLRRLKTQQDWLWRYELVEIPKTLLKEAEQGVFKMMHDSEQRPKPGYCDVFDEFGSVKFKLYFDGGTERKLQIKNLKKSLCIVHADWRFETNR